MKHFPFMLLLACFCLEGIAAEKRLPKDPYGTCCHVTRREQWEAPKLYPLMKAAGITWVRSELDWRYWETKPGKFNPNYAKLIKGPIVNGMNFLPIIPGDQAKFGSPAWKHLDYYKNFLRFSAKEYGDKIKFFELINEPNAGGSWNPNTEQYALLLENTYKTLKEANPSLKVLYAGIAGFDSAWVEKTFKHGAYRYFDVMNLHPYCQTPELIPINMQPLLALLKRYGVQDKPIWLTEYGVSAVPTTPFFREVLPAALRRIKLNPEEIEIAVVSDLRRSYGHGIVTSENLPGFKTVRMIYLDEISKLNPRQTPVLIAAAHERIASAYIPELKRYLNAGGTLVFPSGLPLYFDITYDKNGAAIETQVEKKYLADFHIGWDAWWTNKSVPKQESYQRPAPEFKDKFKWNAKDHEFAGRFLNTDNLKKGDRFIPVLEGGNDRFNGSLAGIYLLNSDLKGNIIVSTVVNRIGVSRNMQAQFLPRSYICGFNAGAERIFWYCFKDNNAKEYFFEAHFGLLDKNNVPKPSYYAMKTLTSFLPGGSTVPRLDIKDNVYLASWKKPDNTNVWALWCGFNQQEAPVTLNIEGKVTVAKNHIGKECPIPNSGDKILVTGAILYLVGPDKITCSPVK